MSDGMPEVEPADMKNGFEQIAYDQAFASLVNQVHGFINPMITGLVVTAPPNLPRDVLWKAIVQAFARVASDATFAGNQNIKVTLDARKEFERQFNQVLRSYRPAVQTAVNGNSQ